MADRLMTLQRWTDLAITLSALAYAYLVCKVYILVPLLIHVSFTFHSSMSSCVSASMPDICGTDVLLPGYIKLIGRLVIPFPRKKGIMINHFLLLFLFTFLSFLIS